MGVWHSEELPAKVSSSLEMSTLSHLGLGSHKAVVTARSWSCRAWSLCSLGTLSKNKNKNIKLGTEENIYKKPQQITNFKKVKMPQDPEK